MSAPMRGPWVRRRPHLLHLLLLLLLSLTGTVRCEEEGEEGEEGGDDGAAVDDVPPEEAPDGSDGAEPDVSDAEPRDGEETPAPPTEDTITKEFEEGLGSGFNSTDDPDLTGTVDPLQYSTPAPGDQTLSLIIIPLLVALVAVAIGAIVCGIFISRRCKSNKRNRELRKEDPYLDGSSTEKVPMPMFEEDVPSVLELEMEELGQWMKKDGETAEDSNHA